MMKPCEYSRDMFSPIKLTSFRDIRLRPPNQAVYGNPCVEYSAQVIQP